jgi:hypothetical protein
MHRPAGSAPVITGLQVPAVAGSEQSWHAPWQEVWQQVPCSQKPVMHSLAAEQEAPGDLSPQELFVQMFGVEHCTSVAQASKHLLPLPVPLQT